MLAKHALEFISEITILLGIVTALYLLLTSEHRAFRPLATFIMSFSAQQGIWLTLMLFRKQLHLSSVLCYEIFFYSYWPLFVIQSGLMLWIVYSVYSEALKPFQPLRKLGMLVFRWVAGVSLAVSIGIAIGPHMLSSGFLTNLAAQAQQFVNILTLCLLLFVCFALRPLGITPRSRLFGISLGMGIFTAANMVQAAWLATSSAKSVSSPIYLLGGSGALVAMLIWVGYFFSPVVEEQTLLLPTTSPYFLWNRISEALGDAPGFVAVNGLAQDMLSEQEMEAFAEAHPDRQTIVVSPTLMRPAAAAR